MTWSEIETEMKNEMEYANLDTNVEAAYSETQLLGQASTESNYFLKKKM